MPLPSCHADPASARRASCAATQGRCPSSAKALPTPFTCRRADPEKLIRAPFSGSNRTMHCRRVLFTQRLDPLLDFPSFSSYSHAKLSPEATSSNMIPEYTSAPGDHHTAAEALRRDMARRSDDDAFLAVRRIKLFWQRPSRRKPPAKNLSLLLHSKASYFSL